MAGLLDIFGGGGGGGGGGLYGDLLNDDQKSALATRGLLAMAGAFAKAAQPSLSVPGPGLGATIGAAAAALGGSQDEAATSAINAMLRGTQAKKLQAEIEYAKGLGPFLDNIGTALKGLNTPGGDAAGAVPGVPAAGTGTSGYMAVSPSAGGGGGPGRMSYDQVLQLVLAKGFPADKAPIMAATIMAESGGNPSAANLNPSDPGGSYGLTQINAGAHGPKAKEALGNPDRAVELAYDISKGGTDFSPWTAYKTGAYKRYLPQGGAAPSAAAPASAGGGGLLAPNPLSDADPIAGTPKPTAAAPQAAAGLLAVPWAPGNLAQYARPGDKGGPVTVEGVTYPSVSAWNRAMDARATATAKWTATPEATSGGGGPLAAPPGAGGDPIMSVTSADQAGGGEPAGPPALPKGVTMGPAGLEFSGPLAAPAPAAAAPAAPPGPGLLAAPALPGAAPAIPRGVNPAYGQLSTAIGLAEAQAVRAGLNPAMFNALRQALESNPAYKAEVKRGEAQVGLEFAGPMKDAEKAVELRYSEAIAAAVSRGNLPGQIILKNIESQNDLRNRLASGPVPMQITFDKDGVGTLTPIQGGAEAAANAERLKQEAIAPTARETARQAQEDMLKREQGMARFNVNPNAVGPGAAGAPPAYGPGATEPLPTERGTTIPPVTQATPIVGSPKYLEQRQTGPKGWAETEGGWAAAYPSTLMGEQRALAIGNAMKQYQTGAFASNLSEIRASLAAVGVQLPDSVAGDPAKAQEILKNAFGSTLEVLKAFSARPTQNEVTLSLKNWANPDLQPEANLKILAQTVGQMRWERALNEDFAQAKRYGWRDPQDFQAKWGARPENKLQTFVDKAEQEIGPLKGMGAVMTDSIRNNAAEAIRQGANRDAVIKRLRDSGFNPAGL